MAKRAAIIFFSAMTCACGTEASWRLALRSIFDATNSHVLYAEEIDTPWYPASLTKLMTAYLAFSAMRDGRGPPEDQGFHLPRCLHSAALAAQLQWDRSLTFDDALQALIIRSANDVAVAIAQTLSSDVSGFVKDMNPKWPPSSERRRTRTSLSESAPSRAASYHRPRHGAAYQRTPARLSRSRLPVCGEAGDNTENPYPNVQCASPSTPGADGMKTGYTCASGYNIVASATREGHRIIAVVMGEPSKPARNARAAALIEHGFRIYGWKSVFPTARLDNYPSNIIGAGFGLDASLLEHFRRCKALPTQLQSPPPQRGRLSACKNCLTRSENAPTSNNLSQPFVRHCHVNRKFAGQMAMGPQRFTLRRPRGAMSA